MEVIEHIPAEDGKHVISELRRVIKPSGVLLISTPNYPVKRVYDYYDAMFHQKWARLSDDPTYVILFNHERLTQLLGRQFTQIEARPFKQGFFYKGVQHPALLHKLFFLCHP
jgi:2-polyprenyl-3-methyl-5-hydroxy-6-metoxy-1,4-benzoquinol methylase